MSGSSGGSQQESTPQATPQQLANVYQQNLPGMLGVTTAQVPATANILAQAANQVNPIYTAGGLSQLQQYAPGYQQAGANLATQQAGSTAGLIGGAGGQAAMAANTLDNSVNPAQGAANTQATNLVNSINLNGLSGGEQSAAERSLNQSNYATGNLGLDNATNAVSNAMNFGNALQAKRTALGSALGTATNVSGAQNNILNPGQFATSSGNTSGNFGLGTFAPTQGSSTLTAPLTFGQSIFGGQASNASASASKGSSGTSSGGISCFLTTACCEAKGLPDDCEELTILRKFRDEFVPKDMVEEYYKVAPYIVSRIKNNDELLNYVYGVVTNCVKDIKSGRNSAALHKYSNMFYKLKNI